MMSVSAKRPASFSIDSIMRNDRESSASPRKSSSVSPDPAASLGAHLLNMKSLYENHYLAESMGLGMNHPALAGALPSSLPGQIGCLPPHNPSFNSLFLGSAAHRDPLLLNPWMMARRNHLLAQRFGGGEGHPLLMQPFRKPKRIRTAFSPSQLLKLEQSFEKNHYVVGQERKDLASGLGLTETQVKVWFQNRRTKHKRTKDGSEDGNDGQKYDSDIEDDLEICDDEPIAKRQCFTSDRCIDDRE